MRLLPAALFATALLAAAPARADFRVEMEIRFLGMEIGRAVLSGEDMMDERAHRLLMSTTGMVERLTGFEGELTARSRRAADGWAALHFTSFTSTDRATREVALRYDGAGDVVDLATFKRGKPQASEVPPALRAGTVDPLTAFANIRAWLDRVRDTPPATTTLPVFDGRRRYDLEVAYLERRQSRLGGRRTDVLELRLTSIPIAGFDDDEDAGRPITALISDDDQLVPLVLRTDVLGDLAAAALARRVCPAAEGDADCRTLRW